MVVRITRIDSRFADIPLPQYVTVGAAGMDLCAAISKRLIVHPGKTALIPTGLSVELPQGYEAQIRPRSGLAIRHNVGLLNSPGTVDSDYRGEIRVVLTNFGEEDLVVRRGDRIAQMVVAKYVRVRWKEVDRLRPSQRGKGGFGHTGR